MAPTIVQRWQTRRVRSAYARYTNHTDPSPGFTGMVAEMAWGLAHLEDSVRVAADDAVLDSIFVAPIGIGALRAAFAVNASLAARVCAAGSTFALAFLVGRVENEGGATNRLPRCEFRETGGSELCEEVCRRPTERYCNDRGIPIRLEPDRDSLGCTWRWGPQ